MEELAAAFKEFQTAWSLAAGRPDLDLFRRRAAHAIATVSRRHSEEIFALAAKKPVAPPVDTLVHGRVLQAGNLAIDAVARPAPRGGVSFSLWAVDLATDQLLNDPQELPASLAATLSVVLDRRALAANWVSKGAAIITTNMLKTLLFPFLGEITECRVRELIARVRRKLRLLGVLSDRGLHGHVCAGNWLCKGAEIHCAKECLAAVWTPPKGDAAFREKWQRLVLAEIARKRRRKA